MQAVLMGAEEEATTLFAKDHPGKRGDLRYSHKHDVQCSITRSKQNEFLSAR